MGNSGTSSFLALPNAIDVAAANAAVEGLLGKGWLARWTMTGGLVTDRSYARRDLQRSQVSRTVFDCCDFSDVAANGVMWSDNTFLNCRFDRSDLEFADLSRSRFVGNAKADTPERPAMISGAGFNGVVLRDAILESVVSNASSFAYADFTGATIRGCALNGTFEGCLFQHATLADTTFVDSNIGYADFSGATFHDTSVGFSDLPYLLGIRRESIGTGLTVLARNDDTGTQTAIDCDRLEAIGHHVIHAHLARQDFFAAANMAFMLGDRDHLLPLTKEGIRAAWMREDHRELKLLCKLVRHMEDRTHIFGRSTLRRLYDLITTGVSASDEAARRQYELHDGQIRSYLLAASPESLYLEFESLASTPEDANRLAGEIILCLNRVIAAAGLGLEVAGSEYSFNSNPRHIIELRVVGERTPATSGGPSPWWGIAIGVIGLLFNGISAMRPFFEHQPQPSVTVQQVVNNHHTRIETWIVPQSFAFKQDGLPLTTWQSDNFALTGRGARALGTPPAALSNI